jgi:hypothetical protein
LDFKNNDSAIKQKIGINSLALQCKWDKMDNNFIFLKNSIQKMMNPKKTEKSIEDSFELIGI